MTKQHFAVLFIWLIISIMITTSCMAEEIANGQPAVEQNPSGSTPTVTVATISSSTEESVEVPITIDNPGQGICGVTLRISFDSRLQLSNIRTGSAFSALTFTRSGDYLTSKTATLLWDGLTEAQATGEIAILTFQLPEGEGVYHINVGCEAGDIVDGNLNDVDVTFVSGSISVMNNIEPDFILPVGVVRIEDEAFMGGNFTYVKLSSNVVEILDRAFANCPNLHHIFIPEKTTKIASNAFEGTSDLTIHGVSGSYAETFALTHGYSFKSE